MTVKNEMRKITGEDFDLLPHRFQVMLALFCAEQCREKWQHIPEAVRCIKLAEMWLDGMVSREECGKAGYAALKVSYIGTSVAYTISKDFFRGTHVACAATIAVRNAEDKVKIYKEIWEYFDTLLRFDKISEQILLHEEVS